MSSTTSRQINIQKKSRIMELTALTLNCWGIAGISKDRRIRIDAIGNHLLQSGCYDFVFLQEVWVEEDFQLIANKVANVMPYSHYFHSGVIGGGICILSRAKIIDVFFHAWSLNGYMHKIQHGDWFGGKGVGLCTVIYHGLKINLYVTHLHAEYNPASDEYRAHRVVQAFETSQLIRYTRNKADVCILGGDLNTEPGNLPYRLISDHTSLQDLYLATGKPESEGTTSETPGNSYTALESLHACPNGKRIDFIMCSSKKGLQIETVNVNIPLPSRVPGYSFSYSDHEAVCAKFQILESQQPLANEIRNKELSIWSLKEALQVCDSALRNISNDRRNYWLAFCIFIVLLAAIPLSHDGSRIVHYTLTVTHLFLTLVAVFCLIMATLWNRIELHGILAGKLAMITRLKSLENC